MSQRFITNMFIREYIYIYLVLVYIYIYIHIHFNHLWQAADFVPTNIGDKVDDYNDGGDDSAADDHDADDDDDDDDQDQDEDVD